MIGASDPSNIERLSPEDALRNVELSRSVGWQDVESEWRVLHAAAEVRGVRRGERLVAQGALADYGNAACLAKMIVAPELQRQGVGGRLLDGFLADADGRGTPVSLCATDQGRPLYASRGFEVSAELVILLGEPQLSGTAPGSSVVEAADVERIVEQDRAFAGCDRSRMVRARFREARARAQLVGKASGFGLATQQSEAALVGPIWAHEADAALALALALFAAMPGPVRIDVPVQHVGLRRALTQLGLKEVSVRVEMTRKAARAPWQVPERFALATQAWG
ncbi:MAG TPA: GNAT family N-acetyltransferase [Polyangiaceae bacterium]|nr:GNAT family N-acetyltransferase [Polyangiaceae bacterium]